MFKTGRIHAVSLVVLLCALLGSGSVAALSPPSAFAGPLEGVTGSINEAVGAPLKEVTETVTAPVEEVTETVAPPVKEVTGTVTRPAHEATQTLTPPVQEVGRSVREVTEPVVTSVTEATGKLPSSPATAPVRAASATAVKAAAAPIGTSSRGASAGTAVREATVIATHAALGSAGAPTDSTFSGPASVGEDDAASPHDRDLGDAVGPLEVGRPADASSTPDSGPSDNTFEAPSSDGSVRAPLAKWMAYVWPAIALTGPRLADFLGHLASQGLSLALAPGIEHKGSDGSSGVLGAHASGGRPEVPHPSSLPFSKITSAIGNFPYNGSGEVLAYIVIVAMMAIIVLAAARWEIVRGRREGRG